MYLFHFIQLFNNRKYVNSTITETSEHIADFTNHVDRTTFVNSFLLDLNSHSSNAKNPSTSIRAQAISKNRFCATNWEELADTPLISLMPSTLQRPLAYSRYEFEGYGTDCGNSLELSRMLMIQRHQFLRRLANARRFWFSSELAALEVISLDVKCSSQSETEGWSKHSRKKTFTSTAIVPHTHLRKLAAVILLFCNRTLQFVEHNYSTPTTRCDILNTIGDEATRKDEYVNRMSALERSERIVDDQVDQVFKHYT
ncbi:unnamed protein product [Albugo candida]|uniref:Uncharacterized protein n=1 Tax=Albugo candida TaxID=65357 RepID=A0A024G9A8_9STRA|nr:unnamed protein product [Albugo candida]|eukprot:CCI43264.1 unnamed protein product [Albugo candida]